MTATFEPGERVPLGRTGLRLTRLGFGGASIGGLFSPVGDDEATATLDHAWDLGIRYFDTAPLYGYGLSERRVGRALREHPRDAFVLSTKVGRLVRAVDGLGPGADIDRQALDGREDAYYHRTEAVRVEESLARLGLDRIDIAFIHDPDDHWAAAIEGAYPALHRLREEGVVGAIGGGMNQSAMLARFAREGDFDVFLLAGRYTLLDQEALSGFLPLCVERGIAVTIGGVMNSGILADPRPGGMFNYNRAAPALVERARRIEAVCAQYGVPLKAAAIQFPLAHPAVVSLVAGVRQVAHLDDYPAMMRVAIPLDLWADLRTEGLLAESAPTPP